MEDPQATVGGRGFSTYSNTSATGTVTTYQNSFVFAPGAGGGLENFSDTTGYSINKTPDFIAKLALDPGFGHYEIFGIVSTYQNRVYPCAVVGTTAKNFPTPTTPVTLGCPVNGSFTPSTIGAYNNASTGGAIGASATAPLLGKKMDVGLRVMYGDGEGRYASAQLADSTLRPDGTIALVHNAAWLGRIEWHATPKWDLYGYVGGEYAARTAYVGYRIGEGDQHSSHSGLRRSGTNPVPRRRHPAQLSSTDHNVDHVERHRRLWLTLRQQHRLLHRDATSAARARREPAAPAQAIRGTSWKARLASGTRFTRAKRAACSGVSNTRISTGTPGQEPTA